jgi:glycosyltransferase involved in cell wall biosynthesis
MINTEKKILLLGRQITENDPDRIGGVIALFELLKNDLSSLGVDYDVHDMNRHNYKSSIHFFFSITMRIFSGFKNKSHISLHGTANDFFYLAPLVVFFGKFVFKSHVSLRKFAGNFDELYDNAGFIKKWLARYAMKNADAVFFETKYLKEIFRPFNKKTFWFPNVRAGSSYQTDLMFKKRFVFIGQVKKTKGINEILAVFPGLPREYSIDIYGPLSAEYRKDDFLLPNVTYKGPIAPDDAPKILSGYDVLVLPTYHPGEGYPGVIIEAFSVGVPVISTNMRGIREIVNEDVGVLIDGGSADQLLTAVCYFNSNNYDQYHAASMKSFSLFDAEIQAKEFISLLDEKIL